MRKLWTTLLSLLLVAGLFGYGCGGSGYDEESASKASASDSDDDYYDDESDDAEEDGEEEAEPEGAADWIVEAVEGNEEDDEE